MKHIDTEKLYKQVDELMTHFAELENETKLGNEDLSIFYQGKKEMCSELLGIIDSLQQKPQEEICSKCIHHGKDDGYCYNPHGGMQSWINENGIYKCTGFCEKEQEQQEVDLEKEVSKWWDVSFSVPDLFSRNRAHCVSNDEIIKLARHFYRLGLKVGKEK